jgi:cell division protein ZapA
MKQIEVQIMGQSYLLASSDDGEAMLRQAVAKVDTAMCQIRDAGKIKARDRIAVLAALNIAAQGLAKQEVQKSAPTEPIAPSALSPAAPASTMGNYAELMSRMDRALAQDGRLL